MKNVDTSLGQPCETSRQLVLVGYIRVSGESQQEGLSLSEQARKIQDWCTKKGYTLTVIYSDVETGDSLKLRTGFCEAVRHTNKIADGLVVLNFDRYARNVADSELIRNTLIKNHKKLFSVQEAFDLEDLFGTAAFQTRMVFAELERKLIRKRMVELRQAKVDAGGWVGHGVPFGYKAEQGELVLDSTEQECLKFILRLAKWTNLSSVQIADLMNGLTLKDKDKWGPKSAKKNLRARHRPYKQEHRGEWSQPVIWRIIARVRPRLKLAG